MHTNRNTMKMHTQTELPGAYLPSCMHCCLAALRASLDTPGPAQHGSMRTQSPHVLTSLCLSPGPQDPAPRLCALPCARGRPTRSCNRHQHWHTSVPGMSSKKQWPALARPGMHAHACQSPQQAQF